jgi:sec-independent protein translocase protein TatC
MATAIRTIGHEDRLTLVDHLDELRVRLIVSAAVLAIAFGFCLWQNHALLQIINKPLQSHTRKQLASGQGTAAQAELAQRGLLKVSGDTQAVLGVLVQPASGLSAQARAQLRPLIASLKADVAKLPRSHTGENPVTLGVGEPLTTTVTVAFYFALVISLPLILYELYGFVLPAFTARERRVAVPLLSAIPFLFVAGVAFGYFVVLPAAVHFLLNFNSDEFDVLVQASQFYGFEATVLLAMGLVFQVPVAILAATRLGIVTPKQLRRHRPYAIVVCAVVAALLPGDAITMVLETLPLYLLYEASILLASFLDRSKVGQRQAAFPGSAGGSAQGDGAHTASAPSTGDRVEPGVQEKIDHGDRRGSD